MGKLEDGGAGVPGGGGEFCCKAAYPSPQTSLLLGRLNLHVFRMQNTRFDIIGGALYFLLVVSPLTCSDCGWLLNNAEIALSIGDVWQMSLQCHGPSAWLAPTTGQPCRITACRARCWRGLQPACCKTVPRLQQHSLCLDGRAEGDAPS